MIRERQAADEPVKRMRKGSPVVVPGGMRESQPAANPWTLPPTLKDRDAPTVVDEILKAAIRHGVTDVHVEPRKSGLVIRFRLDGILHVAATHPESAKAAVISRLKILAGMNIAEHRVPQDGRASIDVGKVSTDLRVSTLPSQFGEKVVIRLLRKDASLLDLARLKMPDAVRHRYQDALETPMGFFLVTGPTGCGKTTTLYATLNAVDSRSTNVITLEDPIEYSLEQVTQVPINEEQGLTFASGLRSILRQDPDVVLVGEVRDVETVEIAFRAALTGHKVFSTLHTNDACQAVTRLLDMGSSPYLIAATLRGVLAQRLIRVICDACREPYEANQSELALLGYPTIDRLHRGAGCERCNHTGYRGRVALFEYLRVDETIHRLILERASHLAVRHAAERAGMATMGEYGKKAVLDGRTTVAELQRVLLGNETQEQLCEGCQRVVGMDYVVCPFCQHRLTEVCTKCKASLDAHWEACPSCGQTIERVQDTVYCPTCVAPVDPHADSCPYCGGLLSESRAIA